jgi:hypothetical protein
LRQKTRKRLLSLQAKEAEDITEDDDNLNTSVEELIKPTEHPLDPNGNYENDSTNVAPVTVTNFINLPPILTPWTRISE